MGPERRPQPKTMKSRLPILILLSLLGPSICRAGINFSWESGLEGWAPADGCSIVQSPTGATDGTQSLAITTPMTAMWYSTPVSINLNQAALPSIFTGATELTLDLSYPDPGYNSWVSDPNVEVIIQGDGVAWSPLGVRTVPVGGAPQTFTWPLTVGQAASLANGTWAQIVLKFTYGNGGTSTANAVFYVDKLSSTVVIEPPPAVSHFWKGDVSDSWAALNWTEDAEGTTATAALPTDGTAGIGFSATGAANLSTVLGANQNVRSMIFSSISGPVEIGGTHNLTLGEKGILVEANGGPVTINTTGQVILGADQLWANNSGGVLSVDSVISGNAELTTGGSGTTFLLGANTHTVGTKVQQGTLVVGDPLALGPVTTLLTVAGGTVDLNGLSPTIGGLAGGLGGVITNLVSEPSTLTINDAAGSTYGGAINDSFNGVVSVVKKGSGPLTLGGNSSFSGSFLIEEGEVTANTSLFGAPTASSLGNAQAADRTITVESTASLLFNTNNVLGNQQANVSSLPTFRLNGSTLNATRYNLIGNVVLNGGTLSHGSSDGGTYLGYQLKGQIDVIGTTPSFISTTNGKGNHLSDETFFNVANVTGDADADLIVTTPLVNQSGDFGTAPGGLSKIGPGTLVLEGVNAYSGPTKVLEGTLSLASASLSDLAAVELSTGTVLDLNFADVDIVGSFVVNGTPKAEGTWGAIGSGADHESAQLTGPGLLVVPGDAFLDWIATFPSLSGANAARGADPDLDGLTNLEEFAFNGDPTDRAISGKVRARVETIGAGQALVITLPVRTGAVLSGTAPALLATGGMSYEVGGSNDLSSFNQTVFEIIPALTGNPDLPLLDAGWAYRTFRLDGNVGGGNPRGPKGFLHALIIDEAN
jgi:autotransporter-associated beta strand protein